MTTKTGDALAEDEAVCEAISLGVLAGRLRLHAADAAKDADRDALLRAAEQQAVQAQVVLNRWLRRVA